MMFTYQLRISQPYVEVQAGVSTNYIVGSSVYHFLEGWSWIDSLYFSVITLTTIGYGDFSPVTDTGKLFTIFYIIIGLGMILTFINTVYRHYNEIKYKK